MDILLSLAVLAALFFITGRLVHWGVTFLYERIRQVAWESEDAEIHEEAETILKSKATDRYSVKIVRDLIIYVEVALFSIITIVVLESGEPLAEMVEYLGISSSVWLSLKVVGNHQQWSRNHLGRATFYAFLLGSIASILRAMLLGYVAWLLLL